MCVVYINKLLLKYYENVLTYYTSKQSFTQKFKTGKF